MLRSMRIAVCSFGSEGDIRPFLALARGLRAARHDAWFVAAEMHRARADEAGVPFRASGPAWPEAELRESMTRVMQDRNPLRQVGGIFESVTEQMVRMVPGTIEATRDAELIVHHQVDVTAFAAAEVHHKARISGYLFTSSLLSRAYSVDGRNWGPVGNLLASATSRWLMTKFTDRPYNRVLAAAGLPQRKGVLLRSGESPLLNLIAVSPSFVPPDPLWKGRLTQTGYWFLDLPAYEPPAPLRDFVAAGEPPVVVTFGSMAGTDAAAQTRAIVEGLRQAGKRAVLQTGWGRLGQGELPPNIFLADYVPHDWLLPRASCVVHHGGAGTTAAVLRAGVPQVVVWHLGDQPLWGSWVYRRGVGAAPFPHHKLTPERLARALTTASSPKVVAAARSMGERVRAEDGVRRAVDAIQQIL